MVYFDIMPTFDEAYSHETVAADSYWAMNKQWSSVNPFDDIVDQTYALIAKGRIRRNIRTRFAALSCSSVEVDPVDVGDLLPPPPEVRDGLLRIVEDTRISHPPKVAREIAELSLKYGHDDDKFFDVDDFDRRVAVQLPSTFYEGDSTHFRNHDGTRIYHRNVRYAVPSKSGRQYYGLRSFATAYDDDRSLNDVSVEALRRVGQVYTERVDRRSIWDEKIIAAEIIRPA